MREREREIGRERERDWKAKSLSLFVDKEKMLANSLCRQRETEREYAGRGTALVSTVQHSKYNTAQ